MGYQYYPEAAFHIGTLQPSVNHLLRVGVQGRGWFVAKQYLGLDEQGANQRQPLLLADRQYHGIVVERHIG